MPNIPKKKRALTCAEEYAQLLKPLLRTLRPLRKISRQQAQELITNVCNAQGHVTAEMFKDIGKMLLKTEGIENQPEHSLTQN